MATNITVLDRAIQNAVLWLNEIQNELQWEDREIVYKGTKAVLQTIRDRLPYEELFHFSANLPMIMKGMMMEDFNPVLNRKERIKSVEEFYESIQEYYDHQKRDIISGKKIASGVIRALFNRIGKGEMQKVADNMPLNLKVLFQREYESVPLEAINQSDKMKIASG